MTTLFTGGSVFDGHRHLPDHGLLVDDGNVAGVLSPDELERYDGEADHVDLAGGLVSPGFTDAHCHPIQGGLERTQCDLTDGGTRDAYLALVRTYADGHDKPMAIIETAAFYDPALGGPDEATLKRAWFAQVFSAETRRAFPRIGMINWFEWRKEEPEVDAVIDWRMAGDPQLGRDLLESVPEGWLLFAGDRP